MTPEESNALVTAGRKILSHEDDVRFMHTKLIVAAAGARVR